MTVHSLGDITVQRIVEHEIPVYAPTDLFDEATPEAMALYRQWLEPWAPRSVRPKPTTNTEGSCGPGGATRRP